MKRTRIAQMIGKQICTVAADAVVTLAKAGVQPQDIEA